MIGMERFGLLALAWGLVGFSGVFDLGIGRATTQAIARLRGAKQLAQVPGVLKVATTLSFRTGLIGAVILSLAVLAGAHTYIKYAAELRSEVTLAAYLLAMTIPVQSMSAMFRGVNESFENFRNVSLIRISLGIANFLGPFCVALFTTHLAALVLVLFVSRLIALFLYRKSAKLCLAQELPVYSQKVPANQSSEIMGQLRSFGGWFTVSCLISPILGQSDRFFIGTMISATAVAAYAIPFDVVTQNLVFVSAISSVAFPNLSVLVHSQPEKSGEIFRLWLFRVFFLMIVITSLCALLLPVILPWWIGPSLPSESILIGQILCVGIFANSLGSMYFALLHAYGRADITAKLHIVEFPLFLLALYFLVDYYGVLGAAFSWVGRMIIDAVFLWLAHRMYLSNLKVVRTRDSKTCW